MAIVPSPSPQKPKWIARLIERFCYSVAFRLLPRNAKFKLIHKFNLWASDESVSGPGSELARTNVVRTFLNQFIQEQGIRTVLDIPCGDFNWMQHVNLQGVSYLGGDIVPGLISENLSRHGKDNQHFAVIDITTDTLPTVDLIIVRDLFIHFHSANTLKALEAIVQSGSKFLLTTTWPDSVENLEIRDGYNFNINLELPPFNLPSPLVMLEEARDANSNRNCMGLWEISSIAH